MEYSRRKFAESVKYLKASIKNESLSYAFRQRSVELLLIIYGNSLPEVGDSHLTKKTVKELIATRSVDKAIRQGVRESIADREARENAEAEEQREADTAAALKSFLEPSSPASGPVG